MTSQPCVNDVRVAPSPLSHLCIYFYFPIFVSFSHNDFLFLLWAFVFTFISALSRISFFFSVKTISSFFHGHFHTHTHIFFLLTIVSSSWLAFVFTFLLLQFPGFDTVCLKIISYFWWALVFTVIFALSQIYFILSQTLLPLVDDN